MENIFRNSIQESIDVKTNMLSFSFCNKLEYLGKKIISVIENGGKILICGNGGSAADAQHLAAELLVRLRPHVTRQPLPAIALFQDVSTITACGNDFGFEQIFARNLQAIGRKGDLLLCISTSGNSENIKLAAELSKTMEIYCYGFLGKDGGIVKNHCNDFILIPSENTARIQEAHITIGHALIEYVEEELLRSQFITIT